MGLALGWDELVMYLKWLEQWLGHTKLWKILVFIVAFMVSVRHLMKYLPFIVINLLINICTNCIDLYKSK